MAQAVSSTTAPMDQMNITPLIDVLLVLLILFIITIPIQTHAVKVDIPNGGNSSVVVNSVRNRITIDPAGTIRWNGGVVDRITLRHALRKVAGRAPEPFLELQPDAQARYETVDSVLADIKQSGARNLGFVGNEDYARF